VWPELRSKGVVVYGVSKDPPKKLAKWKEKEGFPFDFVSDESGAVCEAFGAWREKTNYGRTYMGIARITVLVDEAGKVARVWDPVKPAIHAAEVLAAV
jgi:peroxiredoxin Q/BCP